MDVEQAERFEIFSPYQKSEAMVCHNPPKDVSCSQDESACTCNVDKVSSLKCCSSCWEVQHIYNHSLTPNINTLPAQTTPSPRIFTPEQMSPTLTYIKSPVLGTTTPQKHPPGSARLSTVESITASPVIGNYISRKRAKQFKPTNSDFVEIRRMSPDIFSSQMSSFSITDHSSPPQSQFKISQVITQDASEMFNSIELIPTQNGAEDSETILLQNSIEPVSSQNFKNSSSMSISENCSCSGQMVSVPGLSSNNNCSNRNPYSVQNLPRKKRYAKNGLARKLQKCLKTKMASDAMWMYEKQLNKYCTEYDLTPTHMMNIKEAWEECGNFVLFCSCSSENGENETDKQESDDCLVIVGNNLKNSLNPCKNVRFHLYKPHKIKVVRYRSELLRCFYCVSRVTMYESKD